MTDLEKLEDDLDARLEVAGGARSAVEEINVAERREFLSSCKRRREDLHIYLCWEFCHVRNLCGVMTLLLLFALSSSFTPHLYFVLSSIFLFLNAPKHTAGNIDRSRGAGIQRCHH